MSAEFMKNNRIKIVIALFVFIFIVLSFYSLFMLRKKSTDNSHIYSSNELTINKYSEDNIEYTEYLNSDGILTFAADKSYARVVKTYDSEWHAIREEYFDEYGNRSYLTSGYCAVTYERVDNRVIYHYLDANDNPAKLTAGYSIAERINSIDSSDYTVLYYDDNMNPVECTGGYHGISYIYDGDDVVSYTHLDLNAEPMNISSGYSTVVRSYYDDGKIETEMYYDTEGNSAMSSVGAYGLLVDSYYDNGKRERITYLDSEGNPMCTFKGFTSVVYTYYSNGTVKTEMYYGLDGEPYKVDKGYYGMLHDGEKTYYLNKDGSRIFHVDNLIANFPFIVVIVSMVALILFMVLPRNGKKVLLVLYFLFILYETIFFREQGGHRVILNVLDSYRGFFSKDSIRLHVIENIWLFIPYGVGIASLIKNKKIVLCCFLIPVVIELIQLVFNIGTFDVADIVDNCLGEVIGLIFVYILSKRTILKKEKSDK